MMKYLIEFEEYKEDIDEGIIGDALDDAGISGGLAAAAAIVGGTAVATAMGVKRLIGAIKVKSIGSHLKRVMVDKENTIGNINNKLEKLHDKINSSKEKFPDVETDAIDNVIDKLEREKEAKLEAFDKKIEAINDKMDAEVEARDSTYITKLANLQKAKAKEAAADAELEYTDKTSYDDVYVAKQKQGIRVKKLQLELDAEEKRFKRNS